MGEPARVPDARPGVDHPEPDRLRAPAARPGRPAAAGGPAPLPHGRGLGRLERAGHRRAREAVHRVQPDGVGRLRHRGPTGDPGRHRLPGAVLRRHLRRHRSARRGPGRRPRRAGRRGPRGDPRRRALRPGGRLPLGRRDVADGPGLGPLARPRRPPPRDHHPTRPRAAGDAPLGERPGADREPRRQHHHRPDPGRRHGHPPGRPRPVRPGGGRRRPARAAEPDRQRAPHEPDQPGAALRRGRGGRARGHRVPVRGARAHVPGRERAHRQRRARPHPDRRAPGRPRRRADGHPALGARDRRRPVPTRRRGRAAAARRQPRARGRARSGRADHRRPRARRAGRRDPRRAGPRARWRRRTARPGLGRGRHGGHRPRPGAAPRVVRAEPRPRPGPRLHPVHRIGGADPSEPDLQRPLGALGVRHGGVGLDRTHRHGAVPDADPPPLRAADRHRRRARRSGPPGHDPRLRPDDVLGRGPPLRGDGGHLHLDDGRRRARRPDRRQGPEPPDPALHRLGHAHQPVAAGRGRAGAGQGARVLRLHRGRRRAGQRAGRQGRLARPPPAGQRRAGRGQVRRRRRPAGRGARRLRRAVQAGGGRHAAGPPPPPRRRLPRPGAARPVRGWRRVAADR